MYHSYDWHQYWVMDKLRDKILLRIFSFIHSTVRIILHTVSWRWSSLLYNHSLLEGISIPKSYCKDHQLSTVFTAAKRLISVDSFNSCLLHGPCILLAGLSRLRHLTLSGSSVKDAILSCILQASRTWLIKGTPISKFCLPDIIGLRKLKNIAAPLRVSASLAREVYWWLWETVCPWEHWIAKRVTFLSWRKSPRLWATTPNSYG